MILYMKSWSIAHRHYEEQPSNDILVLVIASEAVFVDN